MESLLLLVSLPLEDTGHLLAEETPLCHLLAQRLTELYCLIPSSLDPADIHSYSGAQWRCVCYEAMKCLHSLYLWTCFLSAYCKYSSWRCVVGFAGISSHRTVRRRASRFLAVRTSSGSSAFWTTAMSSPRKHQGFDKIIILCWSPVRICFSLKNVLNKVDFAECTTLFPVFKNS